MFILAKIYYFFLYGTTSLEKARSRYEIKPVKRTKK